LVVEALLGLWLGLVVGRLVKLALVDWFAVAAAVVVVVSLGWRQRWWWVSFGGKVLEEAPDRRL
jgi:hypothetical protein